MIIIGHPGHLYFWAITKEIKNPKNIISITHDDEWIGVVSVANSEAEMKRLTLKEISDEIKGLEKGDDMEEIYPTKSSLTTKTNMYN